MEAQAIPRLFPSVLLPSHHTDRARALEFLRRIVRIQVRQCAQPGDAVYYTVEVFLAAMTSRRPSLNRPKLPRSSSRDIDIKDNRVSDGSVLRRFSECSELVDELVMVIGDSELCDCRALQLWLDYLTFTFNWAAPGGVVGAICRTKRLREKLLTRFLNDLLRLTIQTTLTACESCHQDVYCQVTDGIPGLLHKFLTA